MEDGGQPHTRLAGRQHALLLATVQEFIGTAEPVGSHQMAARGTVGVRAAMVRNLMAELESLGYLHQPHTSAGRVPTEKAYRYFVDSLIPPPIAFEDRTHIELHYSGSNDGREIDEVMRDTSRMLALLTGQAALVTAPRLESARLERVTFVRVREREVMVVFVAAAGGIHHRLVHGDRDYSQSELDRMAGYLGDSLEGRTLEEARGWIAAELRRERALYDGFVRAALELGGAATGRSEPVQVYVDGSAVALGQPEFADRKRTLELLRALEDKTALLDLLERTLGRSASRVSIGVENHDTRLSGLSVVTSSYLSGSHALGSLAVIGPVRMDYGRVIPLVEYTARALSKALDG